MTARNCIATLLLILTLMLSANGPFLSAAPTEPAEAGARSTACSGSICLSELHVNAAGAAETSAVGPADWTTGEWVEIYNSGTSSVDLSGWSVADHYSRSMNFSTSTIVWPTNPSNAVIGAGAYMVIARNGDGQSCGFCMTNSAGVVELVDGSSTQVHSGTWSSYSAEGKTRIENPGDPAADWIESNGLTAGQPNSGGSTGPTWSTSDLRISELLPDAWPSYDNDTYPGGEWLEIENTGSAAIDLTNWSVEDSTGNTLQINVTHLIGAAQSMSIEAGAFRVVAVNGARTYGLFNNAAGSESAFLINPDGDFVSGANYTGPTRMGHAYIAPMIGSGDWVTALWPTPGAPNAVLINATSEVQINEVMVNSTATGGGYPNGEWVELYHAGSGSSINLSGWKMFSGTGQSVNVTDLIVDRSSGAGSLIAVDEYVVVDFPPATAMLVINSDQLSLVNSQGGITQTVEWGANPGQNKSIIPYDPEDITQPWTVAGWQTPAAPNPNQLTGSVNTSTDLRISEIMGNPSGSDSNTYPEGEWVELVNIGNDTLSFEDWRLKDGRNVSLHFNANSIPGLDEADPLDWELEAGEFVVVWRNGSGMSRQNGGDLLSLVNPDGEVTHQVTWDITPMNGTVVQGVAIEDDWVPSPNPTPGAENPAFTQPYTGSTSVEISEVMAQCSAGTLALDGDWLELHNTGLTVVNISRWLVANDNNEAIAIRDIFALHFSDGAIDSAHPWWSLAADGYVVIKPENNGFLSNFNEQIDLLDPNLNKRQEVHWSTTENCRSIEGDASNWVDDWTDTMWPTPGEENPVPQPWDGTDPVLFTRIMPGQISGRDNEFFEITNMGDSNVQLLGWKFVRIKSDGSSNDGTFSAIGLGPGQSVVISQSATNLSEDGGIDALEGNDVLDYLPWMYDSGSSLQLVSPDGTIADTVVYAGGLASVEGWSGPAVSTPPATFNGLVFMRGDGCNSMPDTNTSADWEVRWLRLGASLFCDSGDFSTSGSMTPMVSPDGSLDQMLNWLDATTDSLHLHVYELMSDDLVAKLVELANADIDVTVVLEEDPLEQGDNLRSVRGYAYDLHTGGVDVYWMGYPQGDDAPPSPYSYIHSKVAVRDEASVWIGSGNWKPSMFPPADWSSNRDWGVFIDSPDIAQLVLTRMLWDENRSHPHLIDYDPNDLVTGRPYGWDPSTATEYDPVASTIPIPTITGDFDGQVFTCPDDCIGGIVDLLDSADTSIELSLQGFDMGWHWGWGDNPLVAALERALARGVQVRLLINGYYVWADPDIRSTVDHFNNEWNRTQGWDATAVIMSPGERIIKLHNKGVIVDGESVLISSINWNSNAVLRNREMGIVIHNTELTQFYLDSFEEDWNRVDSSTDTDGDNMPDWWEIANGLNRTSSIVPGSSAPEQAHDFDNDGLDNLREYNVSGNPLSNDTDQDCISDLDELVFAALMDIEQSLAMTSQDADGNGVADGEQTDCGRTLSPPDDEPEDNDNLTTGPSLPARDNPLDSMSARFLMGLMALTALALLGAFVVMLLQGRWSAKGVVTDSLLDFDEQGEGLVDPYTADLTTEGGAPVDEGPKVVDTRDSAVARDDGVFGAPQLDGFEFEGWTPKKVQEALASGWTIEQLREHYKEGNQ